MKKSIIIMSLSIIVLSIFASLIGLFSATSINSGEFLSVHGQQVELFGRGIYAKDSISVAAQGIASDAITLLIAVPALLISVILYLRNKFIGSILLQGLLGYFLYTYTSYVFLWNYNQLFLVYVALMSLSLYTFILLFMQLDIHNIKCRFKTSLNTRLIGIFQITTGIMIAMMWLQPIILGLVNNETPLILEHYTTLVIQGLDLGIIIPLAIVSGKLIIQQRTWGYILSSIVIVKSTMLLIAISAMGINQYLYDSSTNLLQVVIFMLFTLFSVYCLVHLLSKIKNITTING